MDNMDGQPKPDISSFKKYKPQLADFPEHLKDPANFETIEKSVINTFRSSCNHSTILEWTSCIKCSKKMVARRLLLRKLGFKNPTDYMTWKKIHMKIKEMYPLVDWKAGKIDFKRSD